MTLSLSRILVPTDFSQTSDRALAVAIDFASRYGAKLVLLHVHQVPSYVFPDGIAPLSPELTEELERSIARELEQLVVRARQAGVEANWRSTLGAPSAEIIRLAEELAVDLIVLGTHGRSGLRHVLLGSVAERVVRTAHCPVLTVHLDDHAEARV